MPRPHLVLAGLAAAALARVLALVPGALRGAAAREPARLPAKESDPLALLVHLEREP